MRSEYRRWRVDGARGRRATLERAQHLRANTHTRTHKLCAVVHHTHKKFELARRKSLNTNNISNMYYSMLGNYYIETLIFEYLRLKQKKQWSLSIVVTVLIVLLYKNVENSFNE